MDRKKHRIIKEEAIDAFYNSIQILGIKTCLNEINLGTLEGFVNERKVSLITKIERVFKSKYVYSDTGDPVEFNSDFFEYTLDLLVRDFKEFKKQYLYKASANELLEYHKILFESNQIRPADE